MSEETGVSTPKSFSFKDVNHWVHIDCPQYEELQSNSLGMAQHIDKLHARLAKLEISEEEMRAEFEKHVRQREIIGTYLMRTGDRYMNSQAEFEYQAYRTAVNMMQERCK